jgi:DNA-binding NtrC family response regulator
VIAATNQDLDEMVENKTFRKDLFYRLSILLLSIPPLRERREDIPLLADYFLSRLTEQGNAPKQLAGDALKWLMAQKWPGNVRELKNVLERAVLLSGENEISLDDLAAPDVEEALATGNAFRQAKRRHVESFEKNYIVALLKECEGNISKAALKAGLARRNFQSLIKKHQLKPNSFRKAR